MAKRVITYNFGDDLIGKISDILYKDFYQKGKSLDKIACVFGGKRPALFLKEKLSAQIKRSFLPPLIFSMDEFMQRLASPDEFITKMPSLELYYLVYRLSRDKGYFLSEKKNDFSLFLSWAKEIVSFIEQLDLEDVQNEALLNVEKSASIGYEVPESINCMLKHIISIRKEYHKFLKKEKAASRGLIYLEAAKRAKPENFSEFDQVFFCNLYYLHKTEKKVIKAFAQSQKGIFIFEGSAKKWPILKDNSKLLAEPIEPGRLKRKSTQLNFYQGFDTQSQVSLAGQLLKKIKDKSSTLILLPDPESLVPFLSEAASRLGKFNVSLGYPLKKSSLYALFEYIFQAYQSKKQKTYYSQDYLKVLKHPFVKNILFEKDALLTRILIHKIEEALCGNIVSSLGGSFFVSLGKVEKDRQIYKACRETLSSLGYNLKLADYNKITNQINDLFFRNWEKVDSLNQFSQQLELVLNYLAKHPLLCHFPLEGKALDLIYKIKEDFNSLTFSDSSFSLNQIWEIFKEHLDSARISFLGSPLKGAQILGLFETRSLQFKNVIVLDANEGILPKLKTVEPLIPSEVMMSLGLGRLYKEEEIQRYNFMRLIESAQNVSLIWAKNQAQEKSRFIESIIWEKEKKQAKINSNQVINIDYSLSFSSFPEAVKKTEPVMRFLQKCTYSVSRVNTYLECPLRFYYKYVLGLGEKKDLLAGVKDSQIGDFIHQFLFEAYSKFLGEKPVFDSSFESYFQKTFEQKYKKEIKPRMHSDHFLLKGIIEARLKKFLAEEKKRQDDIVKIESLEKKYAGVLNLKGKPLKFQYIVDRIDFCRQGRLLVIDYKTGGRNIIPSRLSSLVKMGKNRQEIRDKIKSFQLPLYSYFIANEFKTKTVEAFVYNLRTAEKKPFILPVDYHQKEKVLDSCLKALKFILGQILDSQVPFEADRDWRRCQYCPYYNLCS